MGLLWMEKRVQLLILQGKPNPLEGFRPQPLATQAGIHGAPDRVEGFPWLLSSPSCMPVLFSCCAHWGRGWNALGSALLTHQTVPLCLSCSVRRWKACRALVPDMCLLVSASDSQPKSLTTHFLLPGPLSLQHRFQQCSHFRHCDIQILIELKFGII
jgi:hypothetical protein